MRSPSTCSVRSWAFPSTRRSPSRNCASPAGSSSSRTSPGRSRTRPAPSPPGAFASALASCGLRSRLLLSLRPRRRLLLAFRTLRVDALGKLFATGRTVPLFVRLVRDLARHQKLRELASLGLALEWHSAMLRLSLFRPHAVRLWHIEVCLDRHILLEVYMTHAGDPERARGTEPAADRRTPPPQATRR